MTAILLSNMLLSGSIPSEIGALSNLQDFSVSNNNLSSTIPGELLSLPSLQFLSMSSNCFSGYLPTCTDISYGSSLQVLDMNALSSGTGCQNIISIFKDLGFSSEGGYYPNNFMLGGVPACLWSLPHLTTMYLAANG